MPLNPHRTPTPAQEMMAGLRRLRFVSGQRFGKFRLSPRLDAGQQRAVAYWIDRYPEDFWTRIPQLRVAAAQRLDLVRGGLRILESRSEKAPPGIIRTQAPSFIPQRYVVLSIALFRTRIELGRVLYHELGHFLWARLGNPNRARYRRLLAEEFRRGIRGELWYSAEWRKEKLLARAGPAGLRLESRAWRDYASESFCETGAYLLLGKERRKNHSEFTLSGRARNRRLREWAGIVFGGSVESIATVSAGRPPCAKASLLRQGYGGRAAGRRLTGISRRLRKT